MKKSTLLILIFLIGLITVSLTLILDKSYGPTVFVFEITSIINVIFNYTTNYNIK